MGSALAIVVEERPEGLRATLKGAITEGADFSAILSRELKSVVLDLSQIQRINSFGVREWVNFITTVAGKASSLTLEKCSPAIVQQLNMISKFAGGGKVSSVYAPYVCNECGAEHVELVTIESGKVPALAETMKCKSCEGEMEFDDLVESYFSFC